mmetsp:Transcript_4937/g.11849  ORF Transcript_4937/g.11849 Transcript_4937/m.11849 type:complete len:203 (-) Transcript_4937:270-878(-)
MASCRAPIPSCARSSTPRRTTTGGSIPRTPTSAPHRSLLASAKPTRQLPPACLACRGGRRAPAATRRRAWSWSTSALPRSSRHGGDTPVTKPRGQLGPRRRNQPTSGPRFSWRARSRTSSWTRASRACSRSRPRRAPRPAARSPLRTSGSAAAPTAPRAPSAFIGQRSENRLVFPSVLTTVGRRAPMARFLVGAPVGPYGLP